MTKKINLQSSFSHKDRLTRFGYELIEFFFKKNSNGEIIILNKEEEIEPEEEMVKRCITDNECIYSKNEWFKEI